MAIRNRYAAIIFNLFLFYFISADGDRDTCSNSSTVSHMGSSWRTASFNTNCTLSGTPSQESSKRRDEVISYDSMPDLFALEHYGRCMSRPGGTYCVIDIDLANVPGQLYDYIMKYSSLTMKHYYHARLHRGVCVSERCGLDYETAHNGSELLACLNRTIFQESGMQVGQVKIQYCNSADKEIRDPDTLDRTFTAIITTVVLFVVSGTIYHLMVQAGWVSENKYASAFSLIKNWQILAGGSGTDTTDTFESLQGMRFLTMLFIIGAHGFLIFAHGYVSNPDFIEGFYEDPVKQFMLNGRVIVQTFFVMSGFLLSHHVLKEMNRKPLTLKDIPSAILNRIGRLLPTVMVTVGLMTTWVQRMGSGPLWDLIVSREHRICRDYWWKQILFIQNYYAFDTVCLPQTWYIAADTQLYLVSLVVLSLVVRYRARAGLLLGGVLALSVTVSALQTYWQNISPVRASFYPETFVALFAGNRSFVLGYMSSQANWTGYTLGMLTAYIHYQAQKNKWDLQNSQALQWLFYATLPVGVYAVWAGAELNTRAASRLEAVLFNALDHNVFAAAMCVFILGCIYKCDRILRGCVEWAPLQPMGRLSFCALLLHTAVLRTYLGQMPGLMHGTFYNMIFMVMGATVFTFLLSLVMFLFVEQPACQLQKILIGHGKRTSRAPLRAPESSSEGVKQKALADS